MDKVNISVSAYGFEEIGLMIAQLLNDGVSFSYNHLSETLSLTSYHEGESEGIVSRLKSKGFPSIRHWREVREKGLE